MFHVSLSRREPTRSARRDTPAFTLIEVLVVVAIIALLISILLPSMARAREQSRRIICASRLHNIGLANQLYANSNRQKILECSASKGGNGQMVWTQICIASRKASRISPSPNDLPQWFVDWRSQFKKLLLEREMLECPNRPGIFGWEGLADPNVEGFTAGDLINQKYKVTAGGGVDNFRHWILGYQYFGGIKEWAPWTTTQRYLSRSPIDNNARGSWALAADVVMKVDTVWGGGRPSAYGNIPPHVDPDGKPAGSNVLTFDGAVTWIPRGKLIPWHKWGTANRDTYSYQQDLGDYGKTNPQRGIP